MGWNDSSVPLISLLGPPSASASKQDGTTERKGHIPVEPLPGFLFQLLLWQFNMFDSICLTRLIVWTLRGKAHNCETPCSDDSDEHETAEPFRGKALSRSLAPDQALKKSWALVKDSTNHLCQNNHLQEHVGKDHFQRDGAHGMHIKAWLWVLNNYCVKAKSHFQNIWKERRAETTHTSLKITWQHNFFFVFLTAGHQSNPGLFPRSTFILLFVTKVINSHLAHYCPTCRRRRCHNYTILSFPAVSDARREEDSAGSRAGEQAQVCPLAEGICQSGIFKLHTHRRHLTVMNSTQER